MTRLTRRQLLGGAALTAGAMAAPKAHAVGFGTGVNLGVGTRSATALGGRAFAARIAELSDYDRYAASVDQVLAGNVPYFLRTLTPVDFEAPVGHVGPVLARIFVTSDYLSVGSRDDFVRVPLDLVESGRVACALDMALPTPRMVDAIFSSAAHTLAPAPLPPSSQMRSMPYVLKHQDLVESARAGVPIQPLLAGHKKDVVLTGRLHTQPDRVAIYGWHRPSGRPIQPLSLVHGKRYADYSHGVRLVSRTVLVDGAVMDLFDALADPLVAPLLTKEGTLAGAQGLLRV